jgi:hypothetical protein
MSDLLLCRKCFIIRSNIGLCVSVYLSFVVCAYSGCMWKHCNVFSKGPFFQCGVCSLFSVFYPMCVAFEILMLVIFHIVVFWVMTSCTLIISISI